MEIADDEPCDVVENVVQAGDDKEPVEHAVGEETEMAGVDDPAAELVDPAPARGSPPRTRPRPRGPAARAIGTKRRPPKKAR